MGLPAEKRMSFTEFCNQAQLGSLTRAGFEAHVKLFENFTLRPFAAWQDLLGIYQSMDRRRK